ncbi:ankyrin protein [Fusarium denticulatum]|uniref:Ankyrin protein n=1 Tax=Fusarium denticulatum TaxID=48507 RepID=A0A8H5XJ89_9HYPO|nr:ankyrin protein [Fusarium denticulatum]
MKPGTSNSDLYDGIHIDRRRIVEALLRSGADPHVPGCKGDTALHLAAMLGDVETVQNLLDYGADIHTSNTYGDIPLVLAVRCGKGSIYMKLLERGALDVCGKNRRTALIEAASVGNLTLMEDLIRKGANVDHQEHYGYTALMHACRDNNAKVIELLLAANAQLGIESAWGETALTYAIRRCEEDSIKRLLRHSRNPAIRDQHSATVLISASWWHRSDIVSLILKDTECKITREQIDVAFSQSYDSERVGRLLIDRGADLSKVLPSPSRVRRSILNHNDAGFLKILSFGIDIENHYCGGDAPVHTAAARGTETMVQALIDQRFCLNRRAASGLLPLDYAMRREDKDTSIAELLRKHGAITEGERLVQLMRDRKK